MASEPNIDHSDMPTAARDIHREYGGPGIMLKMADEIERLREALFEIKGMACGPVSYDVNPSGLLAGCGRVAKVALNTDVDG